MNGFGSWHLRTCFLASLMKVPTAWQMASILFQAPDPGEFWCAANITADPCSSPCAEYNFSQVTVTFVTQWNLVCHRQYLVPFSQVCFLFGVLFGGVISTLLLRCISPRIILMCGVVLQVAAGLGMAFSTLYEVHCIFRFMVATSCVCGFSSGYVICTDVTRGRARIVVSACYEHMWSVGVITLAGIAYLLDNWIHLQLAISIPTVLIILCYPWIPDSPTWLLTNRRQSEVRVNRVAAAAINGTERAPAKDREAIWCKLVQNHNCLALHVVWATTIVTYYGALLNVKSFGSHLHLNTTVIGIAEIPGVLFGLAVILWYNDNKWMVLSIIMVFGGCAGIASWGLPTQNDWSRELKILGLGVLLKFAVAASFTIIQVTSGEILPKVGIFSCITIARIFLLSASFIGYLAIYGEAVSLSIFGSITFLGGIAAFFISKPTQKPQQQVTTWNKDMAPSCYRLSGEFEIEESSNNMATYYCNYYNYRPKNSS